MSPPGHGRRRFIAGALAAGAALGATPAGLRAEPRGVRLGAIHPVTGPLADIGQACRLAAQIAVDMVNRTGGIAALGGARLELVTGDSGSGPPAARTEAERLLDGGARALVGAFHSGHTAAVAAVAQRRRRPLLVDTSIADAVSLTIGEVARRTREPLYVFHNFPTTTAFGRRAAQYLAGIFADAGRAPQRGVVLHTTDALGTTQARRFEGARAELPAGFEVVDVIALSPKAADIAVEMARVRAAAADVLLLAVRPPMVAPIFRQLARDPVVVTAIVSLGTPDLAEAARGAGIGAAVEGVMELAPWPNYRTARTRRLAEEFAKRSWGRPLPAAAGYAHEAIVILADALERAGAPEPEPLTAALRQTNLAEPLMVAGGPVTFDAEGDNPNAAPALLQIFAGRPTVVWPKAAAERPYVLHGVKR